jgi:hypothetical protein
VNERVVQTAFVFDRHAATDVSVAYAILVPQRRARIVRAGQKGRPPHDQRGDLCSGVVGPAEKGLYCSTCGWLGCGMGVRG